MPRNPKDYTGTIVKGWVFLRRYHSGGRDLVDATKTVNGQQRTATFTLHSWASRSIADDVSRQRSMLKYIQVFLDTLELEQHTIHMQYRPQDVLAVERPCAIYRVRSTGYTLVYSTGVSTAPTPETGVSTATETETATATATPPATPPEAPARPIPHHANRPPAMASVLDDGIDPEEVWGNQPRVLLNVAYPTDKPVPLAQDDKEH